MGFEVKLYSFSKRENSTAQPSGGTTYIGNLKSPSGILNPTIEFDFGGGSPANLNYAYVYQFSQRYYFIREWTWEAGLWTAHMEVDVLASYKTQIGNSTLYVLRASREADGTITDTLYPADTTCTVRDISKGNVWQTDQPTQFVIGVVTNNPSYGSLAYYAVDIGVLSGICRNLLLPAGGGGILPNSLTWQGVSQDMITSLIDPIQYIKTCVFIPTLLGNFTNITDNVGINIYSWVTGFSGARINKGCTVDKELNFSIPDHPQTSRGRYLNSSPFTQMTLTIPPFGCITLDPSITCNSNNVKALIRVDPITGKGVLVLSCVVGGETIIMNRVESQVGVPIALSQVTRDYIGAITNTAHAAGSVLGAIGGGAAGVGSAIAGAASGIGNAVESITPRAQTIGTTGSYASNKGYARLNAQFFHQVTDDNPHNGRPLCKMRTLGDLGGYQMIQDGDVSTNGTSEEDAKIRAYLEGGYYYE